MVETEQRIMKLGQTGSFRYIGFMPPLSDEEIAHLPRPVLGVGDSARPLSIDPYVQTHADGAMDIGFEETSFVIAELEGGETFVDYAQRVAERLGNCALDTEVYDVGPGSVIAQANGADPEW